MLLSVSSSPSSLKLYLVHFSREVAYLHAMFHFSVMTLIWDSPPLYVVAPCGSAVSFHLVVRSLVKLSWLDWLEL
jgi:hypothetical protein